MKKLKNKKTELVSWLLFTISALLLYFVATDYTIFPKSYKLPLLCVIIALICISGIISILSKRWFRYFSIILNVILIVCMMAGLILLPNIEKRVRSIFKDVSTEEAVINVYTTHSKYKEDFNSYSDSSFIIQNKNDLENQSYALDILKEELNNPALRTIKTDDIVSAVEALYNNEGDLLILNEAYVDSIEEIEMFSSFSNDTRIVYTIKKEIEVIEKEPFERDITNALFTVYIAGEDTRSGRLSIYGRTDVDIVVNVNPVTKQVMIIGIPRDTYIPNPAKDYGYDKLTHLGNDGIQNTMKGVSEYYDIDIDFYGVVNFNTFRYIVNALDGIDVDNPYYFTTAGGNGSLTGEVYEFPQGTIHLYGEAALAYCRERYNLVNGDYGRSEHQTIVIKAIIQKLLSAESLSHYDDLLYALQGQFLTNIDIEDIYKLIAMQLDDNSKWDIISYHLGGEGDMQGTASMGWNRRLYVVHPFQSQVDFIKQETEKMKNNEIIKQETLPDEDKTYYIPN
ncbi:MAG: LCP family protein [Erysipelotrichaceae bacterium]|nr:LCP family protein [Erysipelotrichaceae bacterium]